MLREIPSFWNVYLRHATDDDEIKAIFRRIATEIIDLYLTEEYEEEDSKKSHESDFGNPDYQPNEVIYIGHPPSVHSDSEEDSDDDFGADITSFPEPGENEKYHLITAMVPSWETDLIGKYQLT